MERKWERSKMEIYAEKWWLNNGYSFEIKKEWISKTVYIVRKDDKEWQFEVSNSQLKHFNKTMEMFQNNWDMYFELQRLKKLAKQKGVI